MDISTTAAPSRGRRLLSKVPEVTIWFWIIKILCTTVGESFADWINMVLGVGLIATAVIFIIVTAVVLAVQMRLRRYVPAAYWLTVVVMSVTGTLLTDILTDQLGVPLWASSLVFSLLLVIVFGVWYSKERTLSIHSIDTTPREAFYWVTVLVTFALGTALGDWTLELTGWGPGVSILLPLTLLAIVTGLWRYGANPVLAFWIAYILTRPLGANIGDWLGLSPDEQGLGLGTFVTSIIFLLAILATVVYLSLSKADVDKGASEHYTTPVARERRSLVAFAVLAVAVVGLLAFTNSQPHTSPAPEGAAPACDASGTLSAADAKASVQTDFPSADVQNFQTITADTLALVTSGDQAGAKARATDLETAWDDAEPALSAANCQTWTYVDQQIDPVLSSVRAGSPDPVVEKTSIQDLLTTLAGR
ncbi:hypothetical protein C5C36_09790 [Rathayibacter sp. AY1G1]|jgi:uncharacterized membrane-anchored protein|uniref:COG4705 family protein n=1 Tax=unclassified Rathayibacter TaxID=2609250 RepID=UPI000CE82D2E|nr:MULTISPECIES: hypothetical protein [unclassified Rathayibacter]PPF71655.1 hypothetical protein C5C46_09520 [Rathayibacter sp. AY1E6]PPG54209.1 hypothetical protein C5C41_05035 [Rathayibacter sp. AY1E9]PPG58280.1 hypothetical protein C5C57_10540 [Rathayibacter sp. AY1C5]PPG85667.1 hypothetical protein C5C29_05120 [Rathayibacter sp. AY1H2]PPH05762.1 hypothetical protein C5C44_03305 [Rathayibacter sp. AY1F6]